MVRETEERVDREVGRERGVGVMHLPPSNYEYSKQTVFVELNDEPASNRSLFLLNILFFYFNIIFILFANYKKLEILTQNTKNIILIFFNILSHCLYVAMSYVEIMDPNHIDIYIDIYISKKERNVL